MKEPYKDDFNYKPKNDAEANNEVSLGVNKIVPQVGNPSNTGSKPNSNNPNNNPQAKKKNRTLQFYKFLFYSIKIEIKIHEFFDLIRFSNQSEISLWILSVILYLSSPEDFTDGFVWFGILHFIRGIIGMFILLKLPRSYTLIESMKNIPEKDLETKLFNDITRGIFNRDILEPIKKYKNLSIVYFIVTMVNFVFDIIHFLYILSNIDREGMKNNERVILLSFMITYIQKVRACIHTCYFIIRLLKFKRISFLLTQKHYILNS